MICHFPDMFKLAFFSGEATPLDVLRILHPRPSKNEMNDSTKCVWKYVRTFIETTDSDGNTELVYKIVLMFIFIELKAFLQFVTGAPAPNGRIFVTFDDDDGTNVISANTCGRQLVLSTAISDQDVFMVAMKAVITDDTFTML